MLWDNGVGTRHPGGGWRKPFTRGDSEGLCRIIRNKAPWTSCTYEKENCDSKPWQGSSLSLFRQIHLGEGKLDSKPGQVKPA